MTRYELLDRIGVGGMAEIFRGKAIAAGGFEKPVAIKRILPHLSQDKRFVELLIAEAKVLSLLKHRNIVQIFDVGLGDDGQYFLVMEYVDGKDLGAIQRGLELGRRRIPFDLALHVGAEICEALEHAHSARAPDGKSMSLVHRDVSPSNVLVSRAGELKLTDFGIAKRAEQEATGHGAVRGKFAYISPEQARNEHLDPRSDVFSVGILLWELVTGRRLFSGMGDLDALRAVREAKVPRPRDLDGRLGAEIDALLMSALAPEPRGRPTAGQLGARLRTLRYSLDVTVGDPATELAKIIDAAADALRDSVPAPVAAVPSARLEFDGSEPTVIRIHTADAFSMGDQDGTGMARARQVIDRFEEEETRQALLSRDQMAFLRDTAVRDSGELTSAAEPPLPGIPPRRVSDEQTRAHPPLELHEASSDDPPTYPPPDAPTFLPDSGPNLQFEADEATRLVAPLSRRTPPPERLPPSDRLPVPVPPEHLPPSDRLPVPVPPERLPPSERLPSPERFAPVERFVEPPSRSERGAPERRPPPERFVEPPSRSERGAPPERRSEPPGRAERLAEPERFVEPPSRSERRPRLPTQPPIPPGARRPPTGESHTPPPGTVQERWVPQPPSAAPMHPPPPSLPPPVPLPGIPPTPQAPRAIPATPMQAPAPPAMHAPVPPAMHAPAPAMRAAMPPPGHAPPAAPPPAMRATMPPPGHAQIPPPRQSQIPPPMLPPPGAGGPWMTPSRPIPGPAARPSSHRSGKPRASVGASVRAMSRRKPLKPWVLMVGALLMAFLAFAVTRACIHTAARPVAPAPR